MADKPEDYDQVVADIRATAQENWGQLDQDADGKVSFEEFFKVFTSECPDESSKPPKDSMKPVFDKIDKNKSGGIDLEEYVSFKAQLETGWPAEE